MPPPRRRVQWKRIQRTVQWIVPQTPRANRARSDTDVAALVSGTRSYLDVKTSTTKYLKVILYSCTAVPPFLSGTCRAESTHYVEGLVCKVDTLCAHFDSCAWVHRMALHALCGDAGAGSGADADAGAHSIRSYSKLGGVAWIPPLTTRS